MPLLVQLYTAAPEKAAKDSSSAWACGACVGDLSGILDTWPWPCQSLALVTI